MAYKNLYFPSSTKPSWKISEQNVFKKAGWAKQRAWHRALYNQLPTVLALASGWMSNDTVLMAVSCNTPLSTTFPEITPQPLQFFLCSCSVNDGSFLPHFTGCPPPAWVWQHNQALWPLPLYHGPNSASEMVSNHPSYICTYVLWAGLGR